LKTTLAGGCGQGTIAQENAQARPIAKEIVGEGDALFFYAHEARGLEVGQSPAVAAIVQQAEWNAARQIIRFVNSNLLQNVRPSVFVIATLDPILPEDIDKCCQTCEGTVLQGFCIA
jgi:hypothetical protein